MTRFERMKQACEEKKAKTKGRCEDYECIGIGWCDECLKAAEGREGSDAMRESHRAH